MDVDGDLGMLLHESPQPWEQPASGERGQGADGQDVLVPLTALDEACRLGDIAQRGADPVGEVPAGGGEHDATAVALEERRAERALERAHLVADRAVRNRDFLGGARKAPEARGRLEGAKRRQRRQPGGHPACEYNSQGARKEIASLLWKALYDA